MKQFKYIILSWLGLLLLSGCNQRLQNTALGPNEKQKLTVRFAADALGTTQKNETAATDESTIGSVKGYLFEEGVLKEVLVGDNMLQDGTYAFYPTTTSGDIYFVTNDSQNLLGKVQAGTTTLTDFLNTTSAATALTSGQLVMTGSLTLASTSTTVPTVTLRRAVARLDLVSPDSGVSVRSVTIRGIANQGYVFPQSAIASPSGTEWGDFQKEYPEPGVENHTETLMYLNEQAGATLSAEVIVSFGGGLHRMVAEFPAQISRNRIYTLRVFGSGTQATVTVSGNDWETGSSTDAAPSLKGVIDVESSKLSEGVTVSAAGDSVFIPYTGSDMQLAVRAEAGSEVAVDGVVDRVTTGVTPVSKALESVATVSVTSSRRMPNEKQAYLYLNTYRDGVHSGRVVLVFQPHPIQITGQIVLDETGTCDFGKYIDGELGRITLPEGKQASVAFGADEDKWVKLEADGDELRILGGWRPNDPKADGRTQSCQLVFSNTDGTDQETYEIRRVNQGLPVVKFGGKWWCKYNLRGNATSFADQISIADNTIPDGELAEYLTKCPSDELLELLGDAYQGGYPAGMPLSYNGTAFTFSGMRASAQDFGAIDPTSMAPDGYQIPSRSDWSVFSANENHNLGGAGTRTFKNAAGQQVTIQITEYAATFLDHTYGTLIFYEFSTTEGTFVMCGLGHQWNATPGNIAPMTLIMATAGNVGKSWNMEGYAKTSNPASQNWWKFSAQNSTKTRIIRCIKTPVEYIY